ncbi:plasmid partitioning protein RepB [Cereibacter sp. SYSU M97828]|nr:plasmid partitioning protein RepB [Cereibacter flavus]
MREVSANGIQELDPALVDPGGLKDRLELDPASIQKLAESIRDHGQQVPILVRPIRGRMNRFSIVYGRRRLAAIRSLGPGFTVKAIVRSLEDEAAIIAQGQENNLRVDPSFIEKAMFVLALREGSYATKVIQDALGIDQPTVSRMVTVAEQIPEAVLAAVGPAPDIGRRPWTELASLARDHAIDLKALLKKTGPDWETLTSNARFLHLLDIARSAPPSDVNKDVQHPDIANEHSDINKLENQYARGHNSRGEIRRFDIRGSHLGNMKRSQRVLSLNISLQHQPEFGQWLEENADDAVRLLHEQWQKSWGKG